MLPITFLIKDMEKAVLRIIQALELGEKIIIFGDYDADGVTSTVLLEAALRKVGIRTQVYIPSRDEGYGLSNKGIDWLIGKGTDIIITVDLGITAISEVSYATSKNIKVIVIDHHLPQTKLLPRCIIINPKQKGDKYPNKDLSAGALVYKFNCALQHEFPLTISKNDLKWWLDLAAISTVTDMCPLTDENRVIVHFGLIVIKKTKRLGLQKIIEAAAINTKKINAGSIGFQIGPRLNAAGRVDHATVTYKLLSSNVGAEATKLAQEVNKINSDRQKELESTLSEARIIVIQKKLFNKKIIMLAKDNWAAGIVGLVAGRLMEEYSRPAIVLYKTNELYKGSARSIEKLHLLNAFQSVANLLTSFGGHAKAGGIAFSVDKFDNVYRGLNNYADKVLSNSDLVKRLSIDAAVDDKEITVKLVKELSHFEPYGIANRKPLLVLYGQKVTEVQIIGKASNHIKIQVGKFNGVIFNFDKDKNQPKNGDTIDIVFTPELNEWQGKEKVDLIIDDWKYSINK